MWDKQSRKEMRRAVRLVKKHLGGEVVLGHRWVQ